MKNRLITLSIFIFISLAGRAQDALKDKLALDIPQQNTYSTANISSYIKSHFASDSDRVRAIFVWIGNNINYDIDKVRFKKQEKTEIEEVLKTRKAVCQGYAELFVALCNELNINAVLVPGYTKQQDGSISELSHAWVAAEINNKWFMFDPTWAAGSVRNNQFVRNFSNRYYKLLPEQMIKDHMPFDPIYQFINYPFLFDEFNKGITTVNTTKPYFNYNDTIKYYNSLDTLGQFINAANRINRNGEKNQLIQDILQVLTKNKQSGQSKMGFDAAVAEFNKGTDIFNRYIDLKNKRFASAKNNELKQMIDDVLAHIKSAFAMLEPVKAETEDQRRSLQSFNSALTKFYYRVDEENIFLKKYLQNVR